VNLTATVVVVAIANADDVAVIVAVVAFVVAFVVAIVVASSASIVPIA